MTDEVLDPTPTDPEYVDDSPDEPPAPEGPQAAETPRNDVIDELDKPLDTDGVPIAPTPQED